MAKARKLAASAKIAINEHKAQIVSLQRLSGIQAANKKMILKLQEELKEAARVRASMEKQILDLKQMAISPSKGLFASVFSRSSSCFKYPSNIDAVARSCKKQWKQLYPTSSLTSGQSGKHAYGEFTFEAMARVCHIISSELQDQQKDP